MALYLRKEKQVTMSKLSPDGKKLQFVDTLGFGISWYKDMFDKYKVGHIEVSVRETGDRHFAERLETFLMKAAELYDEVVYGNTKPECKNEIIKID